MAVNTSCKREKDEARYWAFLDRVTKILAREAGRNLDDPDDREELATIIAEKVGPHYG